MDWGEDMKKTGLKLARDQVQKRFDEAKTLLNKTLEEVSYEELEELKELCGFADGLEYALVVLDTFIELEGGAK